MVVMLNLNMYSHNNTNDTILETYSVQRVCLSYHCYMSTHIYVFLYIYITIYIYIYIYIYI